MSLRAGHCTVCDARIWRTVTHGRTGKEDITYPRPDSVYARVTAVMPVESFLPTAPPIGVAPGIGYCAACAPQIGDKGPPIRGHPSRVVEIETAVQRYSYWFTPKFGRHLQAWLRDYCELSEGEQATVWEQWERDRAAVEGVHA